MSVPLADRVGELERRLPAMLLAPSVGSPARAINVPFIVSPSASFVTYIIRSNVGKGFYLFFLEGQIGGAIDVKNNEFGVLQGYVPGGHQVLIQLSSGHPGIVTSREVIFNG